MSAFAPGFTVRIAPGVRHRDGGRTLIGGAPRRVTRLSTRALAVVRDRAFVVQDEASSTLARTLLDSGTALPDRCSLPVVDPEQVTVVIPVRDRAVELDRLLGALGGSFPVLVVDDCSADARAIAEVAAGHGARRLRLAQNVGPAAARNAGLQACATPYLVFVDSDVVIGASTVGELVRHFGDPKVAAVAPRIRALAGGTTWLDAYDAERSSLDLGASSSLVRPLSPVGWVPSAVLAVRRDAVGTGFDPALRVAEDVDLVWRLDAQGWLIRYDADLVAHHEHRSTLAAWCARKTYYGTGADQLAVRHGGLVAPAVLGPSAAVVAVVALAQRRWSLPVIGSIWLATYVALARRLGRSGSSRAVAAELTVDAARSTGSQLIALLLRHWWPATLVAACFSSRVRRAVLVAAVVDTAIEYRRTGTDLDLVRFAAARRLDDLSYGLGVWISAVRGRSWRALTPRLVRRG